MNSDSPDLTEVTAVLLCGGKGERLRPFTDHMPKPLIPLRGVPLLEHLIRFLAVQGIRKIVVCTGHKAEAIDAFLAETPHPSLDIRTVNSGDANMADRVLDARPHISGPALLCYGDTLANVNVGALFGAHWRAGALATVTVYPFKSPFGIVQTHADGEWVSELQEKPVLPHWINIGFVALEQPALDRLEPGTDLVMFLRKLAASRSLRVHRHQGKHLTINTEKERTEAEGEIESFTPQGQTGAT